MYSPGNIVEQTVIGNGKNIQHPPKRQSHGAWEKNILEILKYPEHCQWYVSPKSIPGKKAIPQILADPSLANPSESMVLYDENNKERKVWSIEYDFIRVLYERQIENPDFQFMLFFRHVGPGEWLTIFDYEKMKSACRKRKKVLRRYQRQGL